MTLAIWSIQNKTKTAKKPHPFYFSLTFSETRFIPRQFLLDPCSSVRGQRRRTEPKRAGEQVQDMGLFSFVPDWIHLLTWILWGLCLFLTPMCVRRNAARQLFKSHCGGKSVKGNTTWGISAIRIAVSSFDSQWVLPGAEEYLNNRSFHCISEYFLTLWQ